MICCVDAGGFRKTFPTALQPAGFSAAAVNVMPAKYGNTSVSFMKGGAFCSDGELLRSPVRMEGSNSGILFKDFPVPRRR